MPELPDITVYIDALAARILGQKLERIRLASPFLLRTVTPPLEAAAGRTVRELRRVGKRIAVGLDENYWLVLHLMIAGRLHWQPAPAQLPAGQAVRPAGSDPDCSAGGQDGKCTNTTGLANGANQVFTVHVTVGASVADGTHLLNTATVTSDAYPSRTCYGRVDFIYPEVDMSTRTAKVRLVFRNPELKLTPGMFVNVDLKIPLGRHITIPASGVFHTGTRNSVCAAQ